MDAVQRAVRTALGNAEDNLARAKMQQRADPEWTSGNDETIDQVVAGYQATRDGIVADAKKYGVEYWRA